MPTVRIPLVGSFTNRNVDPQNFGGKDQQFINCYPQIVVNVQTGKRTIYTYKRPGSTKGAALTDVSSASARGAMVSWTGHTNADHPVAAAFINSDLATNSVWDLVIDAKIGANFSAGGGICTALTETTISGTAHLVGNFLNGGTIEQWYFPQGGTWTKVTDADFTGNTIVGFPAHMDGYVFNMTLAGRILNSDLNSVSAYGASSYITASDYPDKGVTVARHGRYIAGFGEKSIEFFENAGNPTGSPLRRVGSIQMGAALRTAGGDQTVLVAQSTIYWIGNNSEGAAIGIFRFKGMEPEKVSTESIDNLLAAGRIIGFSGTLVMHGMTHIVLADVGATFSWCYCIDNSFWWQLKLASGVIRSCLGVSDAGPANAQTYFTTSANARGNKFPTTAVHQDDGAAHTETVQTANDDQGTGRLKIYKSLRVIGDSQTSTSNVAVSFSDDDGATFSTARNIDMSVFPSPKLTRLGSSRSRSWKLEHSSNTPNRMQAIEIEYDLGY